MDPGSTPDDAPNTKRSKQDVEMGVEAETSNSAAAWPSHAALYEQGLECKAEAHTMASSWTVDARAWRNAGFNNADANGSHLRQKQLECRRMFLSKPTPRIDGADGPDADG